MIQLITSSPITIKRKSRLLNLFREVPSESRMVSRVSRSPKIDEIQVNKITLPPLSTLLWENGSHLMSQIFWKNVADFRSLFTDEHVGGLSTFFKRK